jgi:hypothetical protein
LKLTLAFVVALLWQVGDLNTYGAAPAPTAEPQHLRYDRSLTLPAGASGIACAVLDATVYAHAANWSGGDLRIFRVGGSKKQEEMSLTVSYSAAQPTDAVTATVQNLSLRNGNIVFDLAMPQRAYTVVDLHLAAQNFIATVDVLGSDGKGGPVKSLGTFALFDLTEEHLARSTSLALQESSFAKLYVTLHLHRIDGRAFPHLSSAIVEGATVPASREAQTLYTAVDATREITQKGTSTVGLIRIPAHVPIERVSFVLDPTYKLNFLRSVSITAGRDTQTLMHPQEIIDGEIWRVIHEEDANGDPAIHAAKLTLVAVIASNLREAATVKVEVKNGSEQPLPIKAIQLEMRQRTVCFDAVAGSTYTLRYGDDALRAAVYDLRGLAKMPAKPLVATLGPEELNRYYVERNDARTYHEHNPGFYWVTLLAVIAAIGAVVSRYTKWRGKHR